MDNHFDSIADIFNQSWHFSDRYKTWMVDHIVEHLGLQPSDILVDLGGGTGNYTVKIAHQAQLSHKAFCVEPSAEMCAEARKLNELEVIQACANSFVEIEGLTYNKVLMKEMVHHISDRNQVWCDLHCSLQHAENGALLIVTRPQETPIPLFQAAKQQFASNQPSHKTLMAELETAGFTVKYAVDTYQVNMPKERWFSMLRNRFMSDLSYFTDDEIEHGIHELDMNLGKSNEIVLSDQVLFIHASG